MDCQKVKELLIEYVDGELRFEQKAILDEHLKACSECRQEREAILKLEGALRSQKIAAPGEAFWQNLSGKTLERIRAKEAMSDRWIDRFILPPRLIYAVGTVACLFLFIYTLSHYFMPERVPEDKLTVSQGTNDLYQEVAAEFFTTDESAYSIWSLETVELDELANTLDVNGLISQAVDYPLYGDMEEDVYQLLDQLDAEDLEYVYQSLI